MCIDAFPAAMAGAGAALIAVVVFTPKHEHNWSRWTVTGTIFLKGRLLGFRQSRTCTDCGFTEVNDQTGITA